MQKLFNSLTEFSTAKLFITFLIENLTVFGLALAFGYLILKLHKQKITAINRREWAISLLTIIINTIITYLGFYFWLNGFIKIEWNLSFSIITDFVALLLAMDFLMYIFHLFIHRTFLYKYIHTLHHKAINPKPIDLFILHPIETFSFGALWLIVLIVFSFNFYAILLYLTLNVFFGVIGHLGFEPLPLKIVTSNKFISYFGMSSFHHKHHQDIKHNFGFYTSIWDRMFGTYA